jgi:uncharacterized protein YbjT (DUF2867 family)
MNSSNLDDPRNDGDVLVFGATGQQGGAVARALLSQSRTVRAMVRDLEASAAKSLVADGAVVVCGDFNDSFSVRSAMTGVGSVFSVQPNSGSPNSGVTDEEEVRIGKLVANLAVEAGVQHLVYSSASIISGGPTGIANLDTKHEIEDHIRNLPIQSTIVRPATFMELLAFPYFWSDGYTLSFFAGPEQTIELIAAEDIGKVVAGVFNAGDRFAGTTLNIAGDEVAGADIGAAISRVLDSPVTYQRFSNAMLATQPALKKTVGLFESGAASGNADIGGLANDFGPLKKLDDWLTGEGKALVQSAAQSRMG